jgi:hypothetical protein
VPFDLNVSTVDLDFSGVFTASSFQLTDSNRPFWLFLSRFCPKWKPVLAIIKRNTDIK